MEWKENEQIHQQQPMLIQTPYSVAQLGAMDCAALAVSSATAQREIKELANSS